MNRYFRRIVVLLRKNLCPCLGITGNNAKFKNKIQTLIEIRKYFSPLLTFDFLLLFF